MQKNISKISFAGKRKYGDLKYPLKEYIDTVHGCKSCVMVAKEAASAVGLEIVMKLAELSNAFKTASL